MQDANIGALTTVGFALLIYAAIKMLAAVEHALNRIWGVTRARSLVRRVTDYLAIVVVAPIFLIFGSAMTVALKAKTEIWGASFFLEPLLAVLPVLSIWLGITFVYLTLPNTRIRFRSALLGGIVAGILWQAVQFLHFEFQIGIARQGAVYSSFVAFPLFMLWIYFSWTMFLAGAELAYAHEAEPLFTTLARTGEVDQRYREALAPRLMGRITAAFLGGEPAPSASTLATELKVPPRTVSEVLGALMRRDLVVQTTDDRDEGYLPGRDPDTITVLDLLDALRREEGTSSPPVKSRLDERVDRILDAFDETVGTSLPNYTMRELARTVLEERPEEDEEPAEAPARPADEPAS